MTELSIKAKTRILYQDIHVVENNEIILKNINNNIISCGVI